MKADILQKEGSRVFNATQNVHPVLTLVELFALYAILPKKRNFFTLQMGHATLNVQVLPTLQVVKIVLTVRALVQHALL